MLVLLLWVCNSLAALIPGCSPVVHSTQPLGTSFSSLPFITTCEAPKEVVDALIAQKARANLQGFVRSSTDLLGATVSMGYYFPDISSNTGRINAAPQIILAGGNVFPDAVFTFLLTPTTFRMTATLSGSGIQSPSSFNGAIFDVVSGIAPPITSMVQRSCAGGLCAATGVVFSPTRVGINSESIAFFQNDFVEFTLFSSNSGTE